MQLSRRHVDGVSPKPIHQMLDEAPVPHTAAPKALIVPHAGLHLLRPHGKEQVVGYGSWMLLD
jgi:hypothetical protein